MLSHWLRWGSQELFPPGGTQTVILQISASQIARITVMSYWCLWLGQLFAKKAVKSLRKQNKKHSLCKVTQVAKYKDPDERFQ
jgi:hypothetical protein